MTPDATPPPCMPRELVANTGFLLGRLGFAFKRRALEEVEALGYGMYDYTVLALLAEGARETQGTIADALALDRSQLVEILDGLEGRALIERKRDPNDRRRQMVTLTAAGKRELGKLRAVADRVQDEFFAPLDDKERAALHELLYTLATQHDARYAPPAQAAATG